MNNKKSPEQALAIVSQAADEVAQGFGFALVDAKIGQQGRKTCLEIAIYNPKGRIGLSDCENVSRELEKKLEAVEDMVALLHGPYLLDVSSPGIDRVLKSEREFKVFAGSQVEVKTKSDVGAKGFGQHFLATLVGLDKEEVKLKDLKELPKVGQPGKGKGKNHKLAKNCAPEPISELVINSKQISQIRLYVDLSKMAEKAISLEACDAESSAEEIMDQDFIDEE